MNGYTCLIMKTNIINNSANQPQEPQQGGSAQQSAQPAKLNKWPVHQHRLQPPVKFLYQPVAQPQVGYNGHENKQL